MKKIFWLELLLGIAILSGCASTRYVSPDAYDLAQSAYDRKHYEQARQFYQKFANEQPDHPMAAAALYYWAQSARACGRTREAQEVYERLTKKYSEGFWTDMARAHLKEMGSSN
ncbi:MAG: tetratricopeptide repeat protein [Candidatus Omnitrophica bacterium]|nr:tetratricopeptide repeat protein [Candidatus Omnitrophota bacterium]